MSEKQEPQAQPLNVPDMQTMIQNALAAPTPRLSPNSALIGFSGVDIIMALWANGQPIGVLNLPLHTAKGLVVDLDLALKEIESALGHPIVTPRDLAENMNKVQQGRASNLQPGGIG